MSKRNVHWRTKMAWRMSREMIKVLNRQEQYDGYLEDTVDIHSVKPKELPKQTNHIYRIYTTTFESHNNYVDTSALAVS